MRDLRSLALAAILGALLTHGAWWMWGVKTDTVLLIECPEDIVRDYLRDTACPVGEEKE